MKYYVAGHRGLVGSAIVRNLQSKGIEPITCTSAELDLTDQSSVKSFMQTERPDVVVLAAAKVGGIHANNSYPAEFIYENLMIQANVIEQAHRADVNRLLFLGSSCIYPKFSRQPIDESELLTGKLEPTNEPYAIAKIAGIKLCESYNRQYDRDYRSIMPTNLYGPGDNFHPVNSHVLPGLIRRFDQAVSDNLSSVVVWGTGKPRREFLFVDDMAEASIFVLDLPLDEYKNQTEETLSHINVGAGEDVSIADLAALVRDVVGYAGEIEFDLTKPDGTPRKLMNSSRLQNLGWRASTSLRDGIKKTHDWYCQHIR